MPRSVRAPLRQLNGSDGESDEDTTQYASPASRLRAAMNRLGPSTPPDRRAMAASESDSDLNPVFSARKTLKDVFSRAMRDNGDSPDSKSTSLPPDAQVIDDSQVSSSNFQVSSQATSFNLLRHRLEIPEMSSRMEVSSSSSKPNRSQKSLHHLMQTAQDESTTQDDESVDTARADIPRDAEDAENITVERSNAPANRSLARAEFHTPSPPSSMPDLPAPPKSDEEDSYLHAATKTPRPPGGWFTPVRPTESRDAASPSLIGRTPAPPGAWQVTPAPSDAKKSAYKVRFDEESFTRTRTLDTVALPQGVQSSRGGITLVDSFGRELHEGNDGEEEPVKIVDSLGNEIERSLAAEISDTFDKDEPATLEGIQGKISDIRHGLQQVESRQSISHHRRVVKQRAIPHDRILELAMGSREARIERERLLRQSHLVRARTEEMAATAEKLKPNIEASTPELGRHTGWGRRRTLIAWIIPFNLILLYIIYFCARAYIQHYFLTSHYDPSFAMVDPSRLHDLPFLQIILHHGHWRNFLTQSPNHLLDLFASSNRQSPLSILSRPINSVVRDLPS